MYGKNAKLGKRNLYLTKNHLSRNEMGCAAENHNNFNIGLLYNNLIIIICVTYVLKDFLDSNFRF